MKRSIVSIMLIIAIIILLPIKSQAATSTATLSSDISKIKSGDTVKLTLSVSEDQEINTVSTSLNYDDTIFEIATKDNELNITTDTGYAVMTKTKSAIDIIASGTTGSKTVNIYITLNVIKTPSSTATISTGDINITQLDITKSDTAVESKKVDLAPDVTTTDNNNDNDNNNNDNNNNNNNETNDNNSNENNNNVITLIPTTTTNNDSENKTSTQDATVSKSSSIPQTGDKDYIVMGMIGIGILGAIIGYVQYKKYKNI